MAVNKSNWYSWLRTPSFSQPGLVRNVHDNGKILGYFASTGPFGGIRPALVLDLSQIKLNCGTGVESNPYIFERKK